MIQATHERFGKINVIKDSKEWLLAKDVARVLDYKDTWNMTKILDEDEKKVITSFDTYDMKVSNKTRRLTIINESGLWHAVFKSRKSEAKKHLEDG